MSADETSQTESKRRTAVDQLGGPNATQMYYDADLERPVVLEQKDGWGISKRDYMERTWYVLHPRCYIADHGCEIETISQRTKVDRMESDRYQTLPDETVDEVLHTAVEKNSEWMAVHTPHIPYDGDGGVNVYVDGERLTHGRTVSETEILAKDSPFEPEIKAHVEYHSTGIESITLETGDETIDYSRSDDESSPAEGIPFEPDADRDGPVLELRLDTDCEECGETDYDIEGVL